MKYNRIGWVLVALLVSVNLMAQGPTQYKLKVGDKFTVTSVVEQDIMQTMLGQEMETTQNISTVDIYEVVEKSKTGYKLKTTGISRSINTETGGGSINMDSDMEGDEHLAFRVLTGKSYYVNMNKYGKFLSFEGMDVFKDQVRGELEGTILESQTDQLLDAFDDETLGAAFDGQFYIYQEPGQSWNREAEMVVNNLPISVQYEFSRNGADEIKAIGAMVLSGEFEVMGNMMSADMAGEQSSVFKLDKKSGLATTITTVQDMDGSLEVSDLTVPMVLKTKVTVTISN